LRKTTLRSRPRAAPSIGRLEDHPGDGSQNHGHGEFLVHLPARKIALTVSVTVNKDAFDDQGNYLTPNASQPIAAG
jgi:hypothetical protein